MGAISEINPVHSANVPAILIEAGDVAALAANVKRRGWMIQNVGTNPLFVRFATGASATVFHAVLKGGTGDNDGNGGSISQMGGTVYQGLVSVAGTTPKYVVTVL